MFSEERPTGAWSSFVAQADGPWILIRVLRSYRCCCASSQTGPPIGSTTTPTRLCKRSHRHCSMPTAQPHSHPPVDASNEKRPFCFAGVGWQLEQLLAKHDRPLLEHMEKLDATTQDYGWPLLQTALSQVLPGRRAKHQPWPLTKPTQEPEIVFRSSSSLLVPFARSRLSSN